MEKSSEQLRPYGSAVDSTAVEEQIPVSRSRRRLLFRRCCVCCGAVTVVNIIAGVILMFTLFKSRQPLVRINKYFLVNYETINGTDTPLPGSNATVIFDISMKNRNFVSLKYPLMIAEIHYHGAVIGEARTPPGTQVGRRTLRMNVTVECIMDRITQLPNLDADKKSGVFSADLYTRYVPGRVKIFFIKKHLKIKMHCAASINTTSMAILHLKCKSKFKL